MRLIPVGFMAGSSALPAFVGALDAYTSNLWSAFGIKRLLATYSGNLVRVRRSSDNVEQDIGYLSDGTLDTTALAAFVGSDSAYVVKLYDQSGSNDMTQATTTKQPRIVNAGTYDGFARFDGTDDMLVSANAMPANAALTVAGRFQQRALAGSGTTQTFFCHNAFASAGHNTFGFQQQNNTGKEHTYLFTNGSPYKTFDWSNASTTERVDLVAFDHSAVSVVRYRNGSSLSSVGNSGSGTVSGNFTSEPLNLGSDGSSQPCQMNGKWFAVWSNSQASNGAGITGAL